MVLLGEFHSNRPVRNFLSRQARAMREAGITHFGIEAPPIRRSKISMPADRRDSTE